MIIEGPKIKLLFIRLRLIPLVFVVTRTPTAVRVIYGQSVHYDMIQGNRTLDDMLMVGQAFCEPLQGFCNALLFLCCVSEVKNAIYQDEINSSGIVDQMCFSPPPSEPEWPTDIPTKRSHRPQRSIMSKMGSKPSVINISYTMTVDTSSSQYVLEA